MPCCFYCPCCVQISPLDSSRLLQQTLPPVRFVSYLVADASNILSGHLVLFFFPSNVLITLRIFALVSLGTQAVGADIKSCYLKGSFMSLTSTTC